MPNFSHVSYADSIITLHNWTRNTMTFVVDVDGNKTEHTIDGLASKGVAIVDATSMSIVVEAGSSGVVATSPAGQANMSYEPSNFTTLADQLEIARQHVQSLISLAARDSMTTWMVRKVCEMFVLSAKGQVSLSAAILTQVAPDFEKMRLLDEWEQACLDAAKGGSAFPPPPEFLSTYILEF